MIMAMCPSHVEVPLCSGPLQCVGSRLLWERRWDRALGFHLQGQCTTMCTQCTMFTRLGGGHCCVASLLARGLVQKPHTRSNTNKCTPHRALCALGVPTGHPSLAACALAMECSMEAKIRQRNKVHDASAPDSLRACSRTYIYCWAWLRQMVSCTLHCAS